MAEVGGEMKIEIDSVWPRISRINAKNKKLVRIYATCPEAASLTPLCLHEGFVAEKNLVKIRAISPEAAFAYSRRVRGKNMAFDKKR